ncbi:MAG: DUF1573 domain-containing protein [Ignavibacteriae bacterium]|nr:DUF1573 domain-containing protein [Ignavibacteriota bacterium]
MKKLFLVFTIFIFNISINAQLSKPKISALTTEFDFGNVREGEILNHKFIVQNTGGDVLQITKVKASCGCTAAQPSKNEIKPNDTTSINVRFDTNRRMGKQQKYVYIFTNDPENPQYRLSFTANILSGNTTNPLFQPELKLSKYSHNFGNVKEGKTYKVNIDVSNIGNSNLEIKEIKSSCGCTKTSLQNKNLVPNENSELKIEFNTKGLLGQIARTVTIVSNDPKNPSRVLTLIANIEKE